MVENPKFFFIEPSLGPKPKGITWFWTSKGNFVMVLNFELIFYTYVDIDKGIGYIPENDKETNKPN